jgi:hypothetical protein
VPWHRDLSIVQFSSPRKNLLSTSRHFGTFAEQLDSQLLREAKWSACLCFTGQYIHTSYNKYRVVTGYHYTSLSLSMKQTSATAVASVPQAGGALHMK